MTLHLWGTDFRRSDSEMRQKLYLEPAVREQKLRELSKFGFEDLIYVYTCNRVEFYTTAPNYYSDTRSQWMQVLAHFGLGEEAFFRGYHLEGKSAIRHLLRVATSLESLVLGEAQILGQLKEAHRTAPMGPSSSLDRAFHLAFETAKRVRTETPIGEKPVSVAALGMRHLESMEADFPLRKVAVVGRSPMCLHVIQWLKKNRPGTPIVWANRTVEALAAYPEAQGVELVSLSDFLAAPPQFSHLFTATACPTPIFGHEFFDKLAWGKHLFFDFAEPPDVAEPGCDHKVTVVRLRDLREEARENTEARGKAVQAAELIIEESMRDYFLRLKQAPVLRDFSSIEPQVLEELAQAVAGLKGEIPSEYEDAVRKWAEKLIRKNLYHSQKHLRTILRSDNGGSFPL
jgi:glutamyl-tRNA reductase